ncbi:MAG: hypothetical protein H0X35_15355, partial [Pseudonocardiales bacterium]|nr:hypothetical protein [Pseudonocardiales bacterium]
MDVAGGDLELLAGGKHEPSLVSGYVVSTTPGLVCGNRRQRRPFARTAGCDRPRRDTLRPPVALTVGGVASSRRLRALITNDDGIDSPGLHTLAALARDAGFDVVVAAPHEDAS